MRRWVSSKANYREVVRFSGPGDLVRDVVGYLTDQKHEGEWHNYQCNQYGETLPTSTAISELGKVLYFAHMGEFTAPTAFFFVAPRGVNRNLQRYIAKPSELKSVVIDDWEQHCASSIIEGKIISQTPALKVFLESWNFANVKSISTDEILQDRNSLPILTSWLDIDPGAPPEGVPPETIENQELPYIGQLIDAYSEREGTEIDRDSVWEHAVS